MQKQAPTLARLLTIAVFTLSCFGLLTFLWLSFGGAVPLQPRGFRFHVDFPAATQLATQADVRISGVPVGRVVQVKRSAARSDALIQVDSRFAPVPVDSAAVLRQKTLLGETYVELSPGSKAGPWLKENGTLPPGQVQSTAALDQILTSFDAKTRGELRDWMRLTDQALRGRSLDLSRAFGNLAPTVQGTSSLLGVLDSQHAAFRTLIHDSGTVFNTVAQRQADIQQLVTSGDRVLQTTALRDRELAATVRAIPPFLQQLKPALQQAQETARVLNPSIKALLPVAPNIPPLLHDLETLAPSLRSTFRKLDPVITLADTGLPALERTLTAARPLLDTLDPTMRALVPAVQYLDLYKQELITSWAKIAAATNATAPDAATGQQTHYLRILPPLNSEALVLASQRAGSNRHNPYDAPLSLSHFATGLQSLDCQNAGNPSVPLLSAAPPCTVQPPITFRGQSQSYPHLTPDPPIAH